MFNCSPHNLCQPSYLTKHIHLLYEIQQVSVDVVNHFIGTDLPGLFSLALSSVPLGHLLAGEAINAILDPLEMMTRCVLIGWMFCHTVQITFSLISTPILFIISFIYYFLY